jgi:hypothetical protein
MRPLSPQVWTVQVLTPTSRMSWIVSTPGCRSHSTRNHRSDTRAGHPSRPDSP